jgi:uncharacterized protein
MGKPSSAKSAAAADRAIPGTGPSHRAGYRRERRAFFGRRILALVLDTGVLYAALDESDADHHACSELLAESEEQLVIPAVVLVELEYWIRKFATAREWLAFCEDVHAGAYSIYPLDSTLLIRTARLQAKYADLPLGLVDASVFCTCEAVGEDKVATLDRRHFSILKTEEGESLSILPL